MFSTIELHTCVQSTIVSLLIILFSAKASLLICQDRLELQQYGIEEGLADRNVRYTFRDTDGFLWMVSSQIERFDGHHFTTFNKFDSLHFQPITGIKTAVHFQDSLILFSPGNDLYSFNINSYETKPFEKCEICRNSDFNLVRLTKKANSNEYLIIGTLEEDYILRGLDSNFNLQSEIKISTQSNLGQEILRVYAMGEDNDFYLLDQEGKRIIYVTPDSLQYIDVANIFTKKKVQRRLIHSQTAGLVICESDGSIYQLDKKNKSFYKSIELPVEAQNLNAVFCDLEGHLWIFFAFKIFRVDLNKKSLQSFDKALFKSARADIHHIFQDPERLCWLSTELGIFRLSINEQPFKSFLKQDEGKHVLQFREIFSSNEPNIFHARVASKERHLIRMDFTDSENFESEFIFENISGSGVYRKSNDYLYHVLSNSKVLRTFEPYTRKITDKPLPFQSRSVFRNQFEFINEHTIVYEGRDHRFIVYNIQDETNEVWEFEGMETFAQSPTMVMKIFSDTLLFLGSEKDGLGIFNIPQRKLIYHFNTTSNPALSNDFVNALLIDSSNTIWIGTLGGGLNKLDLERKQITYYTTHNGLPNDLIASMLKDDYGNLWLGTYNGLSSLNIEQGIFRNYFEEDGISNNEFNYLASHKSENGKLYFGTFNGITVFDPAEIINQRSLPAPQLISIKKYDSRKKLEIFKDKRLNTLSELEVNPYNSFIELSFAIPSFRQHQRHEYEFRIQELDANWQDFGGQNSIRFHKLPPGKHHLEVRGKDNAGNLSKKIWEMPIHIKQAFYKTWWFISAIILIGLFLVYLLYQFRIRVLRKEIETRTRIASDLHDEIGSTLTRVSLQMQMMETSPFIPKEDRGVLRSKLNQLSRIVDNAGNKLRDVVWSVDARSDYWKDMLARMTDYASDVLHPKNIEFDFHKEGIPLEQKIPIRWKQNLYLIFKEAVHNVAKHSLGNHVSITIKHLGGKKIEMVIQDNGLPQNLTKSNSGQGLENLKLRAKRMDGEVKIGFNEIGFCVTLKIK
jgi:ligand-binding sensor domain-containing protein